MTLIPSFCSKHRKRQADKHRKPVIPSSGHDSVQVAVIHEFQQKLNVRLVASKLSQYLVLYLRRSDNEAKVLHKRKDGERRHTLCLFECLASSPKVNCLSNESSKFFTCSKPDPHPLSFILHVLFVSFGVAGVIDLLLSTCSIGFVYIVAGVVIR